MKRLAAALLVCMLQACVTRSYQRPSNLPLEGLYRTDAPLANDHSLASVPWQSLFSDPALRALIREGLANNLDLKVALTRIDAARANLAQGRANFVPTLELDAQLGTTKSASAQLASQRINSAQLGVSTSWELDVWGKLRSTKRAYEAQLAGSWAAQRAVRTQLIADIASAYFNLLAYDRELAITEQALQVRILDVETVKQLKQGAVVTGADVVQSEATRYAAEVSIPDIKRSIREQENALSILLGRVPGSIERAQLEQQNVPAQLELGVPAQLLANRPDVIEAELALRSAFELTNVARTYFYPALTLSGSAGLASTQIGGLFGAGTFIGSLLGGLTQPILNQGLNRQRLELARADQSAALYDFQATLLVAGQEVSNALYSFQMAVEKQSSRSLQLDALSKSVEYTKELLRYTSSTNYVDVLTSEQSLLAAQISAINDRLQQLQALVALYRALGGGWSPEA